MIDVVSYSRYRKPVLLAVHPVIKARAFLRSCAIVMANEPCAINGQSRRAHREIEIPAPGAAAIEHVYVQNILQNEIHVLSKRVQG